MLKISKVQFKAITKTQKNVFIDLMITYVTENFPEQKEDTDLKIFVSKIVERGEKYGYELETDYELFVDLHCSYPELNTDPLPPKLLNILTWPDREPAEKNELLFNALKFNYYGTKQ